MKTAILAVTMRGLERAVIIKSNLDSQCDIYTLEKYCDGTEYFPLKKHMKDSMKVIFNEYRNIIMIMSCGIAVRTIAPYVDSKLKDPAVIVLDELGKNVISLLSGHVGGANLLAQKVAEITKGMAVITTASDNLEVISVDMLAKRFGLIVTDFEVAKLVTAHIVNGNRVGLICDYEIKEQLGKGVVITTWDLAEQMNFTSLIYIGNKLIEKSNLPTASLLTKNIVLGIGCRKNTDADVLIEFVKRIFREYKLSINAVNSICTIEIKKDEKAINTLAQYLKVPINVIADEAIKEVEDKFECSAFVRQTVGLGCVCEPSAYIGSKKGKRIISKTSFAGITISVYEEDYKLEDK